MKRTCKYNDCDSLKVINSSLIYEEYCKNNLNSLDLSNYKENICNKASISKVFRSLSEPDLFIMRKSSVVNASTVMLPLDNRRKSFVELSDSSKDSFCSSSDSSSVSRLPLTTSQLSLPEPPDGGWGWVIVIAAFFVHMITDGVVVSFGVLLEDLVDEFEQSMGALSWIGSVSYGVPALAAPFSSVLINLCGCRIACMLGGLLSSLGCLVGFFSQSILSLVFSFGILSGLGASLCITSALVIVSIYFDDKRGTATGLSIAGTGVGALIFAPMVDALLNIYTWRGTLIILSGFFLNMIVCGALMRPVETESEKKHRQRLAWLEYLARESGLQPIENADYIDNDILGRIKMLRDHLLAPRRVTMTYLHKNSCYSDNFYSVNMFKSNSGVNGINSDAFVKSEHRLLSIIGENIHRNLGSIQEESKATILRLNNGSPLSAVSDLYSNNVCGNDTKKQKINGTYLSSQNLLLTDGLVNKSQEINKMKLIGNSHLGIDLNSELRDSDYNQSFKNQVLSRTHIPAHESNSVALNDKTQKTQQYESALSLPELHQMRKINNDDDSTESADSSSNNSVLYSCFCCDIIKPVESNTLSETGFNQGWKKYFLCCKQIDCEKFFSIFDLRLFNQPSFVFFIISNFLLYFWYNVTYFFMGVRAIDHGLTDTLAALLFSILGGANMVGEIIVGYLGDRENVDSFILYVCMLMICGISTCFMPFFTTFTSMAIYSCFYGVGLAANDALCTVLLVEFVGLSRLSNGLGICFFCQGVANIIGPPIIGYIIDYCGAHDPAFVLSGFGMIFAALAVVPIIYQRYKRKFRRTIFQIQAMG